jgi:hypothetical protein
MQTKQLMNKLVTVAALLEVATGIALLIVPSLVGRLLFGEEFTGIVTPVARVLGVALLALGVCCLPGNNALCGMLIYSALATLLSSVSCHPRRMGRPPVMAGSRVTWHPERAPRSRVVSVAKGRIITDGLRRPPRAVLIVVADK